jgi:hypothetical protein
MEMETLNYVRTRLSMLQRRVGNEFETTQPWRVLLVGLALGLVPLWLEASHFFHPGFPYLGDGVSNLLPALHARYSLTHGQLPIYTDLWYGGEYQFMNPLWKGFYPPIWPLFTPGLPVISTLKAILALHYLTVPIIAYWYARQDFPFVVAAPFALVFAMPMAMFNGQFQKVLAWPWIVLLVWQLTPPRLMRRPRWAGLLAGGALGAMLLAGGMYSFFYSCCFVGIVVIALREEAVSFVRGLLTGSLVGLPKLIVSIIPVILTGASRPSAGRGVSLQQAIAGLAGFWIDISEGTVIVGTAIFYEGYAVVGLPVLILAAGGLGYAYIRPPELRQSQWLIGIVGAGVLGLLLATKWSPLYNSLVPVVSMFRTAARALIIVAFAALLATWYALRVVCPEHRPETEPPDQKTMLVTVGVAVLLVLSAANGAATWAIMSTGSATQTDVGDRVAETIAATDCAPVWIEANYREHRVPYEDVIAYALTKRGIPVVAMNYGRIGQDYATHTEGRRTFDMLVVGRRLPKRGRVMLSGGWWTPSRGHIDAARFYLLDTVATNKGPVYLYAADSCAGQPA